MTASFRLDPEWNDVDPLDLPPRATRPPEPVDESLSGIFDVIELQLGPSEAHEAFVTERYRQFGSGPWRTREVRVIRSSRRPQ